MVELRIKLGHVLAQPSSSRAPMVSSVMAMARNGDDGKQTRAKDGLSVRQSSVHKFDKGHEEIQCW